MSEDRLVSLVAAASLLGDGVVTAAHVKARVYRRSLDGEQDAAGEWQVSVDSIERSLANVPTCGGCGSRVTDMVIVKYPNHDRVEFELCANHAMQTAIAYRRQGQVLEVVTYPYQSEGWLKPRSQL
ncbi:MAG: hypothetical protein GY926_14080 [bacterium]|nr:hypothetical protein [bacterium]MCP4966347.1 hypothetical protein [bacterium]